MQQPHPTFHQRFSTITQKIESFPQCLTQPLHPTHHPFITTTTNVTTALVPRHRGRPRGSKNKPKAPPIIRPPEPTPPKSPYVLELSDNIDIIQALTSFCRQRSFGLTILSAFGVVADVSIRQPCTSTLLSTTTFHGRFDILSISATIFPNNISKDGEFKIFVFAPQGQVFGGAVVGPLKSAGLVHVIAATFTDDSSYQKVPLGEGSSNGVHAGGGGGGGSSGHAPVEGVVVLDF